MHEQLRPHITNITIISTLLQQIPWNEEFFTQQPNQHNLQIAIYHEYEHLVSYKNTTIMEFKKYTHK